MTQKVIQLRIDNKLWDKMLTVQQNIFLEDGRIPSDNALAIKLVNEALKARGL